MSSRKGNGRSRAGEAAEKIVSVRVTRQEEAQLKAAAAAAGLTPSAYMRARALTPSPQEAHAA